MDNYFTIKASTKSAYNEAINIAIAWINKGEALDRLGKYTEALPAYHEALKIDPWSNKRRALCYQGKYKEEISAFTKELRI
jgi:tetratricopeptide (TPR) repeat protein